MYEPAVTTPVKHGGVGWYSIDQREIDAVTDALRNPENLFRYKDNSYAKRFENMACEKLDVKRALFVNSGTSALACCLAGLGVGTGDEVIVQAYTYIATASACIEVGAVPVIAEIDESLGLDPADVEKKITPYTKAIIMTHMQGVPGRIAEIRALAKRHNVFVVEDACQAIGSKYFGKYTGVESDAFAWSLNYYKILTCGEGGVFFTNSDETYARAYYQSDPAGEMWRAGMTGEGYAKIFTKACYRASEVSASIALVQLSKLDDILTTTRGLKKTLISHLKPGKNYHLQHVDDPDGDCGISVALIMNAREKCAPFAEALAKEGLGVGETAYSTNLPDRHIFCYWDALINDEKGSVSNYPWNNPAYKGGTKYSKDMCPQSLNILSRSLRLGIHLAMTEQNMLEFAEAINRADAAV